MPQEKPMRSPSSPRAVLAALVLAGAWTCALRAQVPADLVVHNAKVVTVDAARPEARAFAARDGKFVAVGDEADVAPHRGATTRVLDARGRTVVPGLNDSHAHVIRQGRLYNTELRWDG